ncbi:MAG: hypothetical protein ACLQVL_36745 [Terriglobia bacterium]
MKLSVIPDSVLAGMVRDGCYTKGESVGDGGQKFLLVFAVTYGADEGVETLNEAFEAFHDFHSDDDWMERNIQVLTVENGTVTVREIAAEVLED